MYIALFGRSVSGGEMFKIPNVFLVLFIVINNCLVSSADGQDDVNSLHQQLYLEVMLSGDHSGPASIFFRSEVLPPWTKTSLGFSEVERRAIADKAIIANWIGSRISDDLGDIYKQVLERAEWGRIPFQKGEIVDQEKDYIELKGELFQLMDGEWARSFGYSNFIELLRQFEVVKKEWDSTSPPRPRELIKRYKKSKRTLENQGEAAKYRDFEIRMHRLLDLDLSKSHARMLHSQYVANLSKSGDPLTSIDHPLEPWDSSGVDFRIEVELKETSEAPFGYVPAGLQSGFWSEKNSVIRTIPSPSVATIEGQLFTYNVRRPWLDIEGLSGSRGWKWDDGVLSSGTYANDESERYPYTALPISLVFVRNIRITADMDYALLNEILAAEKNGETIRLGSLGISGVFHDVLGPVILSPVPAGPLEIMIPGLQYVGVQFSSHWVKNIPDPMPGLIWKQPLPELPLRTVEVLNSP